MQLNKVYIDGYKNLIKTSIEIQPADIPLAIIGNNGTGKSNLIEALLHIFIGLYYYYYYNPPYKKTCEQGRRLWARQSRDGGC